jgi:hypothetical protein
VSVAGPLLSVDAPAERPVLVGLAARARAHLDSRITGLSTGQAAWLADAPLAWALPLVAEHTRARSIDGVRAALREVATRVAPHGTAWESAYAEILLLALLARVVEATPVATVPRRVWPEAEAGLALVLESAVTAGSAGWTDEFFEKDVAIAQLRLLPYQGGAGRVERIHPALVSRRASLRDRLALILYLRHDFFRPSHYWVRHQWRGFRDGIQRGPTARTEVTAMILAANPHLRGLCGSGWTFDPALRTITPHLLTRYDLYVSIGGRGFRMKLDELTRQRALSTSRTRRELYEAGKYTPSVQGVFVRRSDMIGWAHSRNLLDRT